MSDQYLTITPAGSLWSEQCTADGHEHQHPDVPIGQNCPAHHVALIWCGGCQLIWCAGLPNRGVPKHVCDVVVAGEYAQTLPA